MVNQTLDTVLDIAAGSVEKVGAKFEAIMHRGMPIIIGFLADQVGLGGIGTAIRGIVDKLREQVDKAILWLIDKVKAGIEALIGAVKAGVAAVLDWWSARKKFKTADAEDHELFFEGSGEGAELMIESKKSPARKFLDDLPDTVKATPDWATADAAFTAAKKVIYDNTPKDKDEPERRKKLVEGELVRISAAFSRLAPDQPGPGDYPTSAGVKPPGGGGKARKNVVEFICDTPVAGSKPKQGEDSGTPGWKRVHKAGLTDQSDKWVQMHVVSEQLGGEGQPNNLISAPNSINTGYFRSWEHAVVGSVAARDKKMKAVLWVDVSVSWRGGKYSDFADSVSGRAGLRLWKGKAKGKNAEERWEKNTTPTFTAEVAVPKPDFHEEDLISLNFSSKTDLDKITGSRRLSELITENRTYLSYPDFISKVNAAAKNTSLGDIKADLTAITKDKKVVLKDVSEP